MASLFQISLVDPSFVTAQASEKAYGWKLDRVQLTLQNDGVKAIEGVSANGFFEVASGSSSQAAVNLVYGGTTSRSTHFWRIVSGDGADVAVPDKPHPVTISTRLRLSIWAFTPPLTTGKVTSDKIEIDAGAVGLLKNANVDDLSLVWTVTWDKRDKPTDPAKPPKWHDGFIPRGQSSEKQRTNYLKGLVAALHPDVQVIAGFEIVRATPANESQAAREKRRNAMTQKQRDAEDAAASKDAALKELAADFAAWLLKASADDIKKYAQSINAFFESRGIDVDGIGYDFEFDGLDQSHSSNLALLYQETSRAVAHHNGLVSYANAPFQQDGVNSNAFMVPQPFAIARSELNLLARPMCFDGKTSSSVGDITASIACALRDPADKTAKGGAGLSPSQVQFGIWADKVTGGAVALCTNVLRPNRVGLIVFNLPPAGADATKMLKACKDFNDALNPDEGAAGQGGKPFQVPRGSGGWPPPFKAPTE